MEPTVICCLLKAICTTLRFPGRASAAAHTYLQHYLRHRHLLQPNLRPADQVLVAACVLLASKVEEVPVSNNHLLNVTAVLSDLLVKQHVSVHTLICGPSSNSNWPGKQNSIAATHGEEANSQQQDSKPAEQEAHGTAVPSTAAQQQHSSDRASSQQMQPASPQGWDTAAIKAAVGHCSVLVGDDYQSHKSLVLEAEQQLLRLLQWQLLVCHPTAPLLQAAAALNAPASLVTAALVLLNDATVFTDVLLPPMPVCMAADNSSAGHTAGGGAFVGAGVSDANGLLVHMSETGFHDVQRELAVAVACLLLAAEASMAIQQPHAFTCAACRHAIIMQQHRTHVQNGDAADDGKGTDASCAALVGRPCCHHWMLLLGVDVPSVVQCAGCILDGLEKASAVLDGWEKNAVHVFVS